MNNQDLKRYGVPEILARDLLPEIPAGARAVGMVKQGSVIYQLPPFAQYIVFHQTEHPKIITMAGDMMDLDIDKPTAVCK